jgi:hypothetical protein
MSSKNQATNEDPVPGSMEVANTDDSIDANSHDEKAPVDDEYPHGIRLAAVVFSLMLGMFLVALDNVSSPFCDASPELTATNRPFSARRSQRSRTNSTI